MHHAFNLKNKLFYEFILLIQVLTLVMSEGTECSPRTVASLLDIIALGGLVYFRMKLLLCTCVTVGASITLITVN